MAVPLHRAELIEIAGPDAIAFAHAQFTSDVAGLALGAWQFSAWLSAQGRARSVFVLLRPAHDRLFAWLPLGGAAPIRDALARFVLRAKVQLTVHDDWMLALAGAAIGTRPGPRQVIEHESGLVLEQPGATARVAWIGPSTQSPFDAEASNLWRLADIAAGLPWLAPAVQDEFVPQALELERIDAIRFDKGCYPGQEIAARLHFRGGSKRSLRRLHLHGGDDAAPGARIRDGDADVGSILYSVRVSALEQEALAVLADANVDASRLAVDGARISSISNVDAATQ